MKKIIFFFLISGIFISCDKEASLEGGDNNSNSSIIGNDCRISKIVYRDSTLGIALGSIAAIINASDKVTDITKFDSLSFTLDFNAAPFNSGDTAFISADEYFILDPVSAQVQQFHGLRDPTDPSSPQYDIAYTYDAAGNLINKSYSFTILPGVPYEEVNYTYSGGNLSHMTEIDLGTGDIVSDADLTFFSTSPKNYLYLFPDENDLPEYTQFYNFGKRSISAVKSLTVRYYDPGGIINDSAVSVFSNYQMSLDNYVLSVALSGDDQPSIPAPAGKLHFSYKCR